jgi:hypothetical protein
MPAPAAPQPAPAPPRAAASPPPAPAPMAQPSVAVAQPSMPARPPAPAAAVPQINTGGSPAVPVINDPKQSTATGRMMQRRKSNNNIVLYIAVPIALLFVVGGIAFVALVTSKDKDKKSESANVDKSTNRLVGKWSVDFDELMKRQGLSGEQAALAKNALKDSLQLDFTFKADGTMSMFAKIPDEETERASGKYEIKNVQGDRMDIHLDVKGQFFDEKLPTKFLSDKRFEMDFAGDEMVFKKN